MKFTQNAQTLLFSSFLSASFLGLVKGCQGPGRAACVHFSSITRPHTVPLLILRKPRKGDSSASSPLTCAGAGMVAARHLPLLCWDPAWTPSAHVLTSDATSPRSHAPWGLLGKEGFVTEAQCLGECLETSHTPGDSQGGAPLNSPDRLALRRLSRVPSQHRRHSTTGVRVS